MQVCESFCTRTNNRVKWATFPFSKTLEEFDKALFSFYKGKNKTIKKQAAQFLLKIIEQVYENSIGNLTTNTRLNDWSVTNLLHQRHDQNWTSYKNRIASTKHKLESENYILTDEELKVLEDIADAIDTECETLLKRMREI